VGGTLSRTLKDRPYWVLKNDPKMSRYATHAHIVMQREEIGEEEYDRYPWRPDVDPVTHIRKLYRRWYENIPCTLDIPEQSRHARQYARWQGRHTNEEMLEGKYCEYWLRYYPNMKSDKAFKQLTNQAIRSRINQQLRAACHEDPEDVDISTDTKYNSRGWWD